MDLLSYNLSRKSHSVQFLPTHMTSNERFILKKSAILREDDRDSSDIYSDNLWLKYLYRPEGEMFDTMTYPEYFTRYRQVSGQQQGIIQPPYNQEVATQRRRRRRIVYLDSNDPVRKYVQYRDGHKCLVRYRATPMSDPEDSAVHLLKLYYATRKDCKSWLEDSGLQSFLQFAIDMLPQDVIESHVLPLSTQPPEQQQQQQHQEDLNPEQVEALENILEGVAQQFLVTGSAGTGKSTLLRALVSRLNQDGVYEPIVLSPSGAGANNVGGITLHRFFGAGIPSQSNEDHFIPNLFELSWHLHCIHSRYKQPFFLIDESAMVSAHTLQQVPKALRQVVSGIGSCMSFGSIRTALFEDFAQLGPVIRSSSSIEPRNIDDHQQWIWFATNVLSSFTRIRLLTPCRQASDLKFFQFLQVVRLRAVDQQESEFVKAILKERQLDQYLTQGNTNEWIHDLTTLTARSTVATQINSWYIGHLSTQETQCQYEAIDTALLSASKDSVEQETGLLTKLVVWPGARVLVTSNLNPHAGIVNGTQGIVTDAGPDYIAIKYGIHQQQALIPRETRSLKKGGQSRTQFPLLLSFAITIHRAQGLTLNKVLVDLEGLFCSGQGYVALSRVRRLQDLFVVSIPNDIGTLSPQPFLRPYME